MLPYTTTFVVLIQSSCILRWHAVAGFEITIARNPPTTPMRATTAWPYGAPVVSGASNLRKPQLLTSTSQSPRHGVSMQPAGDAQARPLTATHLPTRTPHPDASPQTTGAPQYPWNGMAVHTAVETQAPPQTTVQPSPPTPTSIRPSSSSQDQARGNQNLSSLSGVSLDIPGMMSNATMALKALTPEQCLATLHAAPSCVGVLANMTEAIHTRSSLIGTYADSLVHRIKLIPSQVAVSCVAFLVGAACVFDGPGLWRIVFTIVASGAISGIVLYEASQAGLLKTPVAWWILALEAFAGIAFAITRGFEGAQVLFGLSLGFFSAIVFDDWAQQVGDKIPGFEVLWYSVGAMLGLILMTGWRQAVLATVTPLLGGLLIASSIGVLASRPLGHNTTWWVPANDSLWPDVMSQLLHGTGGSLVVHIICALVGSLVFLTLQKTLLATLCLTLSIVASGLIAAFGLGCQPKQECPAWMRPDPHWQWPVIGSAIWMIVSTIAVYVQLSYFESIDTWSFRWFDDGLAKLRPGSIRGVDAVHRTVYADLGVTTNPQLIVTQPNMIAAE